MITACLFCKGRLPLRWQTAGTSQGTTKQKKQFLNMQAKDVKRLSMNVADELIEEIYCQ